MFSISKVSCQTQDSPTAETALLLLNPAKLCHQGFLPFKKSPKSRQDERLHICPKFNAYQCMFKQNFSYRSKLNITQYSLEQRAIINSWYFHLKAKHLCVSVKMV